MEADAALKPDLLATLRCPKCRSPLLEGARADDDVSRLECTACGARWPVRFGIPDLRPDGVDDPYLSRDDDLRAAERLFERSQRGGFADALAAYYETNVKVSPAQARQFIAGTMAAEDRSRAVLATWQAWCGVAEHGDQGTVVDLGCGTGPLLVAAQAPNVRVVGIDVGLRWLVLAAARLRDRGAKAVLACAGAHQLPLDDAAADVVASESLLENAMPAGGVLREAARVLRAGGWLRLTTANRWSAGPDPHVGLPLGGWLPEKLVSAWATRHGMVPPRRCLLGAGDLRRLIAPPTFRDLRVGPPPVTDAQRDGASPLLRAAVDAYRVASRSALGRAALIAVGPALLAVARRAESR
jgi:SAM-dependent methyltransferase